jgi:hypothetical protein
LTGASVLGWRFAALPSQVDNIQATKWFAVGKAAGNKEAEKTLGWMWNTGQFG